MLHKLLLGAALSVALSTAAFAQARFGTDAETKAMLEKAVAAVKADKAKAIEMFNKGEGGFKDRDLYPFCFNTAEALAIEFACAQFPKSVSSSLQFPCIALQHACLRDVGTFRP